MAIVKMNKLSVIGMNEEKKEILSDLMDLGVVEMRSVSEKMQSDEWKTLVVRDSDSESVSEYEKELSLVKSTLDIIAKYSDIKKPLFLMRRPISRKDSDILDEKAGVYKKEVNEVQNLHNKLNDELGKENYAVSQIVSLSPWQDYELPLELTETKHLKICLGVMPPNTDMEIVNSELEEADCDCANTMVGKDNEQCYVSLIYMKEDEETALNIIKGHGYTNAGLDDMAGTVNDNIARLNKEILEIQKDKAYLMEEIKSKVEYQSDLEYYHDLISINKDKAKIRSKLVKTKETFSFDGWVPSAANKNVEELLAEYTCFYEFEEPDEKDDIPVALNNSKVVKPMEFITEMYSLPDAREVDPTAIYTLFYITFFGIMFADIGYGIILFLVSLFAIKKYHVDEGGAGQLLRVLSYCGISSAFWGVMFGGFFGDLIPVVAKQYFDTEIIMKPLWIDPVKSSMTLLIFSCGLGVLHLFVGMGIKAYEQIKAGKLIEAINDNFVWYMIVLGAVLWLFGAQISDGATTAGKYMFLAGIAGAIIIPLFINKGAEKALGIWNIYGGVTGNLSDILSYSRLLGLGLASASIAQVVNFLATLGGHGIGAIILFVIVEVIGHSFNFAINALGAFVHSCRLQYVEFFGKFFEGGGTEFRPFEKNTKYIRIIEEGK